MRLFEFTAEFTLWIGRRDTVMPTGEFRGAGTTDRDDEDPANAIAQAMFREFYPKKDGNVAVVIWVHILGGFAPSPLPWERVWRLP